MWHFQIIIAFFQLVIPLDIVIFLLLQLLFLATKCFKTLFMSWRFVYIKVSIVLQQSNLLVDRFPQFSLPFCVGKRGFGRLSIFSQSETAEKSFIQLVRESIRLMRAFHINYNVEFVLEIFWKCSSGNVPSDSTWGVKVYMNRTPSSLVWSSKIDMAGTPRANSLCSFQDLDSDLKYLICRQQFVMSSSPT